MPQMKNSAPALPISFSTMMKRFGNIPWRSSFTRLNNSLLSRRGSTNGCSLSLQQSSPCRRPHALDVANLVTLPITPGAPTTTKALVAAEVAMVEAVVVVVVVVLPFAQEEEEVAEEETTPLLP